MITQYIHYHKNLRHCQKTRVLRGGYRVLIDKFKKCPINLSPLYFEPIIKWENAINTTYILIEQ